MEKLELAALSISLNEPCFSLGEYNIQEPKKGLQRFQVIRVIRNDKIMTGRRNLGPAYKFSGDEFCLMGGIREESGKIWIGHTVAELLDAANQLRDRPSEAKRQLRPNLRQGYYDYYERLEKAKRAVSTFGHGRSIIRG